MMKQEQRRGDLLYVCQRRRGIRPMLRLPADSASIGALLPCVRRVDERPAWFLMRPRSPAGVHQAGLRSDELLPPLQMVSEGGGGSAWRTGGGPSSFQWG